MAGKRQGGVKGGDISQRRVKWVTHLKGKGSTCQRNSRVAPNEEPCQDGRSIAKGSPGHGAAKGCTRAGMGRKKAATKFISLLATPLRLDFHKASDLSALKAQALHLAAARVLHGREKRQRRASERILPPRSSRVHLSHTTMGTRHPAPSAEASGTSEGCWWQFHYHLFFYKSFLQSLPRAGTRRAKHRRLERASEPPSAGGAGSKKLLLAPAVSLSFPNSSF